MRQSRFKGNATLGNRADAEDVLQEYCIRVLARKDQLRDIERMDAWLYAILRSTMNDHYRKTTRHSRLAVAVAREPQELVADAPVQMARPCTATPLAFGCTEHALLCVR